MKLDTILVPVDFSDCTEAALAAAEQLARLGGGRIVLLHVLDTLYYDMGWMSQGIAIPRDALEANRKAIQERLESILPPERRSGLDVETRLGEGMAHSVILEVALEISASLIVIGTHGRRGLSHLFMGSVAEKVVRLASCPVLAIKSGSTPQAS
jgi:universal stress protein A